MAGISQTRTISHYNTERVIRIMHYSLTLHTARKVRLSILFFQII